SPERPGNRRSVKTLLGYSRRPVAAGFGCDVVIGLPRVVQVLCVASALPGTAPAPRLGPGAERTSALSASWIDAVRVRAGTKPALLIWADARLVAQTPDGTQLGSLA